MVDRPPRTPPAGDPLLSVYSSSAGHRRRLSQPEPKSRSRSPSPLPHPSISSSPTPILSSSTTSTPSSSSPLHPSSSTSLTLPSSLLTASATVQQAAGSWWKKANQFYQQATANATANAIATAAHHSHGHPSHPSHPAGGAHSRHLSDIHHSNDGGLPALPSVSSSPTPPRPGLTATAPAPSASAATATPSPSPSSSFLSSVLSSVSDAVSSVSLPLSPSLSAGLPSASAAAASSALSSSDDAAGAVEGFGGDGGAEFVELDVGDRTLRQPEAAFASRALSASSSSSSSTAAALPSHSASPFSLAVSRMALVSSVLSNDVGGYLTPSLFFPRSAFFLPTLRLPAVMQKLQALEAFQAQLEDVVRCTEDNSGGYSESDTSHIDSNSSHETTALLQVLDGVLSTCRKTQNDLAFSLTAIKESSSSTTPDRDVPSTSNSADAVTDGDTSLPSVAEAVSSTTAHSTVDRFSSRVKALGYSLAKSAHRISKSVLPDKMTREQAELYIVFLQRIAHQLHQLDSLYQHLRERTERRKSEGGAEGDGEAVALVVDRLEAVGVFVCEVMVVLVVDDLQRAMLRYLTEQHEALLRGVKVERKRRKSQAEEARDTFRAVEAASAAEPLPSARPPPSASPVRIVFLCHSNSCRSQMAEAWSRHLHSSSLLLPSSAGVLPPKPVDLRAVQVMQEVGVDMSHARSKHVDSLLASGEAEVFDVMVTVCDSESCPTLPGHAQLLQHHFDDPPQLTVAMDSEQDTLQVYRRVRDEIRAYIQQLPAELSLH